jgi:hypothetical protein
MDYEHSSPERKRTLDKLQRRPSDSAEFPISRDPIHAHVGLDLDPYRKTSSCRGCADPYRDKKVTRSARLQPILPLDELIEKRDSESILPASVLVDETGITESHEHLIHMAIAERFVQ